MRIKMKRILGILLSLVLMLGLMPGMSLVVHAATITNNGYPYGKNMSSTQITLVCEATAGTTYKWQCSDSKNGTYTDIEGATSSEYTFTPENCKWYRCVVDETASNAIQAVQPKDPYSDNPVSADERTWTKPHYDPSSYTTVWYLTNGKVAYTTNEDKFDVVGEYTIDTTKYMLCTSYGTYWQMYAGDGSPADAYTGTSSSPAKIAFSFDDVAVLVSVTLATGNSNFAFGCDTQLGDYSTSGDYNDKAALVAALNNDKTLKHIAMVGAAAVNDDTDPNAPAFVIEPSGNPMFWIGEFGSRQVYDYNTNGNTNETIEVKKHDNTSGLVRTRVESTDSGMTMSWKGVDSVQFAFKVGTAKDTGAVAGDIDYIEEKITGLEANTAYKIEVLGESDAVIATYNLTSDENGYIPLAGGSGETAYDLIGKKIKISKVGNEDKPAIIDVAGRPTTDDPDYLDGTSEYQKPEDVLQNEVVTTENSITIQPQSDLGKTQEYRIYTSGGDEIAGQGWTALDTDGKVTFSGLTGNTTYIVKAQIPATVTSPKSLPSTGTSIVTKGIIGITLPTPTTITYDTNSHSFPITVSPSDAAVTYSTESNVDYSETVPSFTDPGDYTVYYRALKENFQPKYGSFEVKINKIGVTAPTIASKTYNGQPQTATVEATDNYSVTTNEGGTNAGNYDVVLTLIDATHYKWTDSTEATKTLTFMITQAAAPEVVTPTPAAVSYDPTKTLEDVTLPDGWAWVSKNTVPTVSNDGYAAVYTVPDYTNYNYTSVEGYNSSTYKVTRTVALTVSVAESVSATVNSTYRTYDGTEQPLVTVDDSTLVGGEMQYAIGTNETTAPTSGWSTSIPNATNSGTYYVWYKVVADANHSGTDPRYVTSTIRYPHYHSYTYREEVIKEPTCTETGSKKKYCSCGSYISETIKATGHTLVAHTAKEVTCTEDGSKAYWECSVCKKLFADKDAKTETTLEETVIKATGHKLTAHEAKAATCTEDGNKAYWECSVCKKIFADKDAKTETTLDAITLKATGHNLTAHTAKEVTCTEDGNKAYWECSVCKKLFSDAEAKTETTIDDVTLKATGHKLTKHAANEPDCVTEGNTAYWTCGKCNKYFADAEGKTEISEKDTVIKPLGHKLTYVKKKDPTVFEDGNIDYWYCKVCGKYYTDSECKNEITLDETVIPALGPTDIKTLEITAPTSAAWTGTAVEPVPTIKDKTKELVLGRDFTVTYKNNKNPGTATMIITGIGEYEGTVTKTFTIKRATLKFRAYVEDKAWLAWQTAVIGKNAAASNIAGTTAKSLRMETIQMQLAGIGGAIKYRAYVRLKGWTQWATTADKTTYAGTKGEARRVEMIQLVPTGEVARLYDVYYRTHCEKFGWLGWARNGEKSGSAGYKRRLEAFQVQFVEKGTAFDGYGTSKSFYDSARDGANPD